MQVMKFFPVPGVKKIPWRRAWQPTAVFLPGKSHGQRNLVGCSPWGCKELDMTEHIHSTQPMNISGPGPVHRKLERP